MTNAFDHPRRSFAYHQMAIILSLNLWTEEEMSEFSPEARDVMSLWTESPPAVEE